MRRFLLFLLLISISFPLFASYTVYIAPVFGVTYDTNFFSNPLPQDADVDYLEWKNTHPFEHRVDLGGSIRADMYFDEDAITGLSLYFSMRYPFWRKTITPHAISSDGSMIEEGGFTEDGAWEYVETTDTSWGVPAFYFSLGPAFRYQMGIADIGVDVRLSVGSRNLFESIELGLSVEPFLHVAFDENYFFAFSFNYDAHFYNFIKNDRYIYEPNFFKLSLSAHIGVGFLFGERSG